jgi:hypothetical protein
MKPLHLIVLAGLATPLVSAQTQPSAQTQSAASRPVSTVQAPARSVDPARADRQGVVEAPLRTLGPSIDTLVSAPQLSAADLTRATEGTGFGRGDGVLVGAGPRYKAGFGTRGPRITTPLGAKAERSLPLTFELESIHVGSTLLAVGGAVEPALAGSTVSYARGLDIAETYELRRDGLEQSFVFPSLPAVDGDLVVRGLVHTELQAAGVGSFPNGIEFRAATGGVSIGGVTGIDAAGRTVQGDLRYDGRHLDLVLPAAFVATAQLPLVLDPLIGSSLTVDSGADFGDPDVSYDETTDDYLVVYERQWSGTDIDVYGQRISSSGALVGAALLFETSISTLAINPSVGNVNGSDRWFVCWQDASSILGPWDITGLAVTASSGALSPTLTFASNAASESDPDVGGEKLTGFDNAVVVWERDGSGIYGATIDINATGTPTVETAFTVVASSAAHKPSISKSGGSPGRYMVAYSRFFTSPAPGDHDLYGAVVTYLGAVLDTDVFLEGSVGPNEDDADVDGDGTNFMLAFERQLLLNNGDHDIRCLRASFDSGTSVLSQAGATVIVEGGLNDDEVDPAIAFTGLKYHLAFLDEKSGFGFDLAVRELDPADCLSCGVNTSIVASATSLQLAPAIASQWNGTSSPTSTDDQVLVAWENTTLAPPFTGTILAQRIQSVGASGPTTNLGGGCAGGGTASTTGALAPGSADFTFTLSGASLAATFGLVNVNVGPAATFPCGTCAGPLPGIIIGRPVIAGASSFKLAIPCDSASIGTVWDYDWIVALVPTSPCPLFANVANSNVLRLTVGQ